MSSHVKETDLQLDLLISFDFSKSKPFFVKHMALIEALVEKIEAIDNPYGKTTIPAPNDSEGDDQATDSSQLTGLKDVLSKLNEDRCKIANAEGSVIPYKEVPARLEPVTQEEKDAAKLLRDRVRESWHKAEAAEARKVLIKLAEADTGAAYSSTDGRNPATMLVVPIADALPSDQKIQQKVKGSAVNANDVMRLMAPDARPSGKIISTQPTVGEDKGAVLEDAVLSVINPADYETFSSGLRKYAAAREAARKAGGAQAAIEDEEARILNGGMSVAPGRMLKQDAEEAPPKKPSHLANAKATVEQLEKWTAEMELFLEDPQAYLRMKAWENAAKAKSICFDKILNSTSRLRSRAAKKIKKTVLRSGRMSTFLQGVIFLQIGWFAAFVASLVLTISGDDGVGVILLVDELFDAMLPKDWDDEDGGTKDAYIALIIIVAFCIAILPMIIVWVLTFDRRGLYGPEFDPDQCDDVRIKYTALRWFNRVFHEFFQFVLVLIVIGAFLGGLVYFAATAGAAVIGFLFGFVIVVFNIVIGALAAYAPKALEKLLMKFAKYGGKKLLIFLKSKSITIARMMTALLIAWGYCITGQCICACKKKGNNEISLVPMREMKLAMFEDIEATREAGENPMEKLDLIPDKFYDDYRNQRGTLDPYKYLVPPKKMKQEREKSELPGLDELIPGCDPMGLLFACCSCAWCPLPEFNPLLNCLEFLETCTADILRCIILPISLIPGCRNLDVKFFEDCAECFLDGWDCKEFQRDCNAPDVTDFANVLEDVPEDLINRPCVVTLLNRRAERIGKPVTGKVLWQGYDSFLPVQLVAVQVDVECRHPEPVTVIDSTGKTVYTKGSFCVAPKPKVEMVVHDALGPITTKPKCLCCPCLTSSSGGFDGTYRGQQLKGQHGLHGSTRKFNNTHTLIVPATMITYPSAEVTLVPVPVLSTSTKDAMTQLKVTWKAAEVIFGKLVKYQLRYGICGSSEENMTTVEVGTTRKFTIEALDHTADYVVHLDTFISDKYDSSRVESAAASSTSSPVPLLSTVPGGADHDDPTIIKVTWPDADVRNGAPVSYKLRYGVARSKDGSLTTVDLGTKTTHVITDLEPATNYVVHLDFEGRHEESTSATLKTPPPPPPPVPMLSTVPGAADHDDPTIIKVTWPDADVRNGAPVSYKLRYGVARNKDGSLTTVDLGTKTTHVITDLEPATNYVVHLDVEGRHEESTSATLQTPPPPPQMDSAPVPVLATTRNDTPKQLEVTWPDADIKHGVLDKYQLRYGVAGSSSLTTVDVGTDKFYVIDDLQALTEYVVHIDTFMKKVTAPGTASATQKTPRREPRLASALVPILSANVDGTKTARKRPTALQVTWPAADVQHGTLAKFQLEYGILGSGILITVEVGTKQMYTIKDLEASTNYVVILNTFIASLDAPTSSTTNYLVDYDSVAVQAKQEKTLQAANEGYYRANAAVEHAQSTQDAGDEKQLKKAEASLKAAGEKIMTLGGENGEAFLAAAVTKSAWFTDVYRPSSIPTTKSSVKIKQKKASQKKSQKKPANDAVTSDAGKTSEVPETNGDGDGDGDGEGDGDGDGDGSPETPKNEIPKQNKAGEKLEKKLAAAAAKADQAAAKKKAKADQADAKKKAKADKKEDKKKKKKKASGAFAVFLEGDPTGLGEAAAEEEKEGNGFGFTENSDFEGLAGDPTGLGEAATEEEKEENSFGFNVVTSSAAAADAKKEEEENSFGYLVTRAAAADSEEDSEEEVFGFN